MERWLGVLDLWKMKDKSDFFLYNDIKFLIHKDKEYTLKRMFVLIVCVVSLFGGLDVKVFEKTCEDDGIMDACTILGELYFNGKGVKRDYRKAFKLFKKACENGNIKGCYNLGVLYENGQGVKRDYRKASELYKKACENGNMGGCGNLGVMYTYGRGVKRDYQKAFNYIRMAAKAGDPVAQRNLDILCSQHPWVCK